MRLIGVLGALLKLNFVYPYIRKLNKLSRIELRHVRSFLSLAKTLSFSRTAEIVHLSQPALSLEMQALEEEIGGKFFERDRRRTVLTVAGVAFQNERGATILDNLGPLSALRTVCVLFGSAPLLVGTIVRVITLSFFSIRCPGQDLLADPFFPLPHVELGLDDVD